MRRVFGFVSAAMLFTAGFTGQYGVVTPDDLAAREAATVSAVAEPEAQLLVPEASQPRFSDSFDPTKIDGVPPLLADPQLTQGAQSSEVEVAAEPAEQTTEPAFDPTKIQDVKPPSDTVAVVVTDPVTGRQVSGPSIIALTTPGCPPCIRWWDGEIAANGKRTVSMRKQFQDKNWKVYRHTGGATSYPAFRVYDGKRWYFHPGFMTGGDVQRMLKSGNTVSSQRTTAMTSTAPRIDDTWRSLPEYTIGGEPWTEASLRRHLYTHGNHRHPPGSLDSLSFSELRQIHNAEHQLGRAAVRISQAKIDTAVAAAAKGYCPTCPQQRQTRSFGLFRR